MFSNAYHGYYSATADKKFGHHVYKTPDGRRVKITEAVMVGKTPVSRWKDLQFVGVIESLVSSSQSAPVKLGMVSQARSVEERIAERLYNALPINPEAVQKRNPFGIN